MKVRTLKDLTEPYVLPNKGYPNDVRAGNVDKKTKGPLLIELAYNCRALPIIGTVPVLPEIEIAPLLILPPKVIQFKQDISKVDDLKITLELINMISIVIISIKKSREQITAQFSTQEHISALDQHAKSMSYHLISRLPQFLEDRIPPNREDLLPGNHWVWSSLRCKMKLITAIMIVSGHLCNKEELQYKQANETLLSHRINFSLASEITTDNENDPDGSYLHYDMGRENYIRSGAAVAGIKKRGKEHLSASMLTTETNKKRDLYVSYPNPNCLQINLPELNRRKGDYGQLEQLMGIGFNRTDKKDLVRMFEWNAEELYEIKKLSGLNKKDSMEDKRYRHICYLCESVYALAVRNQMNISSNPGFEWQLRFYGK